jgi:tetratricopeptide (TPR) repeat protein
MPGTVPSTVHEQATVPPGDPPGSPHDEPTTTITRQDPSATPSASETNRIRCFGDYEIIRELARGGMGVVFQARQMSLNRKVALKMILAGQLADETDVKRFYTEAEAAANLDHPGIVPIFEVGQHEEQHYFSMGFVEGQSLSHRLAGGPLPPREAAALMAKVADAIEYAHQHGVIHRDMKPANILLDPSGNPRVTDFGLAKKVQSDGGLTQSGQIMGTPSYMPPEQASGQRGEVGPAADVYALGATLYALVTGRPPFQAATALDTIIQVLSDEPVPLRQLNASVPRDLETMCLKCLEKDPARRYPSAQAFADDLGRYLAGEPIVARPATPLERAVKWGRRKPAIAALSALVCLVTSLGLGGVLWQWREAVQARGIAERETIRAKDQAELADRRRVEADNRRREAEEAHTQAQKRLTQIEKSNEILTSIFAELDIRKVKEGTDPLEAVLAKRLVKAAADLEGEAVGDPLAVAGLQDRLGRTLLSLGHPQESISLFVKAFETRKAQLGPDHADTLTCMNDLAVSYQDSGRIEQALPLYEDTVKLTKARLGPDHPATLTSMNNLALGYIGAGRMDLALPLLEETLRRRKTQLGAENIDTLASALNLADGYHDAGRLDRALPLYEETLQLNKAKLGEDHPITIANINNLAAGYRDAGKLERAVPLFQEALKLNRARLGADHPDTLRSMNNLAFGYQGTGRLDLAVPLYAEVLGLMRAKLGNNHPLTLITMNNLAAGYRESGRLELALPLHIEAAAGVEKSRFQHEYAGRIVGGLINCYEKLRQFGQAEVWRRKWLAVVRERSGAASDEYSSELAVLGLNLLEQKKWKDAESILRECLAIREKIEPDDWRMFNTQSQLGGALLGQKKYAEAEPLLLKGYAEMKAREKTIPQQASTRIPEAVGRLIDLYTATNKPDEFKKWQAERAKYPAIAPPPGKK